MKLNQLPGKTIVIHFVLILLKKELELVSYHSFLLNTSTDVEMYILRLA